MCYCILDMIIQEKWLQPMKIALKLLKTSQMKLLVNLLSVCAKF